MKKYLSPLIRLFLMAGPLAWAMTASAQQVIAPLPSAPVVPGALQSSETGMPNLIAKALGVSQAGTPFHWGPVDFSPRVEYSFLYGTGLLAAPGQPVNSVVQQLAPGFELAVGSHLTLDYSPTWTFYSSKVLTDTLDHAATIAWGTTYNDWTLGLSQSYATSSGPQVDTGTQTREQSYTTAASANYGFSEDLHLSIGLDQTFSDADKFSDSKEWSTMEWLDYKFLPQLDGGVGAGFGYTQSSGGPDQTDENFQGRLSYQATGKISLSVNGGVEDQQSPESRLSPVFGASIQYTPFDATAFTLSANRTIAASVFTNQNTETTGFTADLTQRFLTRYYASVGGGYNNTHYVAQRTGAAERTDDTYSFNARLSTSFLLRGTIAATYSWSETASDRKIYSYTSHQVGFQVSYRY